MKEAEDYIKELNKGYKENNKNKYITNIVVISGVGVREYYRKIGYKLVGYYMVKKI